MENEQPQIVVSWVRLDVPGAETASLTRTAEGWRLDGTVVVTENEIPASLEYVVRCTPAWQTISATVRGRAGLRSFSLVVEHERDSWRLNGAVVPAVEGAADVDLAFTPSTNLLPIRRLGLRPGSREKVVSAWLRYPELDLVPLEQFYTRRSETELYYESPGVNGTIVLHPSGFAREYPTLWRMVATAG
jgi:hypothetical protein